jgi:hypothetical protein
MHEFHQTMVSINTFVQLSQLSSAGLIAVIVSRPRFERAAAEESRLIKGARHVLWNA